MSRTAAFAEPEAGRAVLQRAPAAPARSDIRWLQRHAGNRAVGRMLMRAPTVTKDLPVEKTANPDQIIVTKADGTRIRVTRRIRVRRVIDSGRPRFAICRDQKRVFLRATWCKGTKGRIDVGADPENAVEQVVEKLAETIRNGGGAADFEKVIREAELKPFGEVEITRANSWKVTGGVNVKVSSEGLKGGDANVTLDLGTVKLKLEGKREGDENSAFITVVIPLGGSKPTHEKCPAEEIESLIEYTCEREQKSQIMFQPPPRQRHDQATVSLYFDYETDKLQTGKGIQSQRNAQALAELSSKFSQGFNLTRVDGWASPEGPSARAKATAKGYKGNKPLSEARAEKAKEVAKGQCAGGLLIMRPRECVPDDAPAAGNDEKFANDKEGTELERTVVSQFVADKAEMDRLPAEDQEFVKNEKISIHRRAQKVYEWLRRADIQLDKHWTQHFDPIWIPTTDFVKVDCDKDVETAADNHWGGRIQFTKPEPDICKVK
jgi:hypothetical protein